jgi:hypothetical protein
MVPPNLAKACKRGKLLLLTAGVAALYAKRTIITQALQSLFPGKELWDYLEVLLVPLVISVVGFALDRRGKAREEALREEGERIRAEERKNQVLQEFLDRITAIILDKPILSLAKDAERPGRNYVNPEVETARDVIRARTLSTLRVFSKDIEKKNAVVHFLIDAQILNCLRVSLAGADLRGANLNGVWATHADLKQADLREVDLRFARLSESNLEEANLSEAWLTRSNFNKATLYGANLTKADLSISNFIGASLCMADLSEANLSDSNFSESDLFQSKLNSANLSRALLFGADLGEAMLIGADLAEVRWDESTKWPGRKSFQDAIHIPEALRAQLGL